MKNGTLSIVIIIISLLLYSCSRGITMSEAANGKAKCGKHLR